MKKIKTALIILLTLAAQAGHASSSILYIGDSHTAGTFGRTLDSHLRTLHGSTSVVTVGSCGSSPEWWFNGHSTSCGYFFHAEGPSRNPRRHPTPSLESLIDAYRPNVIVIALGANLIYQSPQKIYQDSHKLALAAARSGARCIWVGPPHGGNKPPQLLNPLYQSLQEATRGICEFIDSRPYAPWPEGRDGRHFEELGTEGRAIARRWAAQVFEHIRHILGN